MCLACAHGHLAWPLGVARLAAFRVPRCQPRSACLAVGWLWLAPAARCHHPTATGHHALAPLPPFPPCAMVLLLSFSPSHAWACPCCRRRCLAVASTLSAILCHCLALPDGTATAVRAHGALAAPAHGHAHSRGIPTCALARHDSHTPKNHRL